MSRCLFVTAVGAAAFTAPTNPARNRASRGGVPFLPNTLGKNGTSVFIPVRLSRGPSRRLRALGTRAHAGGDASDTPGEVPSDPQSRPSPGTSASTKAALGRLERSMAAAVAAEDFALAATLRDELRATREGDALLAASARLSEAVAAEDYAEAARATGAEAGRVRRCAWPGGAAGAARWLGTVGRAGRRAIRAIRP